MIESLSLDLASVRAAYAVGRITPTQLVAEVLRRIEALDDPAIWIHRLSAATLQAHAARVEAMGPASQPLYGVPFAIKDNIDLAGEPTTAACPEFGYTAAESAPVVARLMAAGAIPIGKTNLDQFATGLVGTRSPYGTPRNPFHPEMIPGGSSSGSACAVSAGLVSFALGTDTAGSGRIPAAFQNIVGLKPTRGRLSTRGVVPACRSLDCVSVFALTVGDAAAVAAQTGGYDAADPFSRLGLENAIQEFSDQESSASFRFGVPAAGQLDWFGDPHSAGCFEHAVRTLEELGGLRVEIDFTPFREAARLLYEGPWLAERWSAIRTFHACHADAILPLTRQIIEPGARLLAVDAFESSYRLATLGLAADRAWKQIDTLVLPTAATIYTRAQIEADPIALNSRLGTYTNFANLLDTAALAVPAGLRPDRLPFGVTLFGPAWSEFRLLTLGARFHRATSRTLGATGHDLPVASTSIVRSDAATPPSDRVALAVVGAHLTGQPLNHQLTRLGARLVRSTQTSAAYRLYALAHTTPPKPGLVRVEAGRGAPIEVEVWELAVSDFGEFVAKVPPPLAIGTITLIDATAVKGFICEPAGLNGAKDVTAYGGWRPFLASL